MADLPDVLTGTTDMSDVYHFLGHPNWILEWLDGSGGGGAGDQDDDDDDVRPNRSSFD